MYLGVILISLEQSLDYPWRTWLLKQRSCMEELHPQSLENASTDSCHWGSLASIAPEKISCSHDDWMDPIDGRY